MDEKKHLKPEQLARQLIDEKLEKSGWHVVDRNESTGTGAEAVREAILKRHHRADYLLCVGGKAIAVLEAKKEEISVLQPEVAEQAEGYTGELPEWCGAWENPLKLVYLSNGTNTVFRDFHLPESRYRTVTDFEDPWQLIERAHLDETLSKYAALPFLKQDGLRKCQYEAISNLEDSLRAGRKKALMMLATGAGKTYTACLAAYRLLRFTPAKRVLFLVDRTNLGRQAENEFKKFTRTVSGKPFSEEFSVEILHSGKISGNGSVYISTIQGLFSELSGVDIPENDQEEDERTHLEKGVIELPEHPNLRKDFFDLIIIDECHRSIYGTWKKVLEYFDDAVKIGLTATPIPETLAYFDNNVVENYTLEQSIVDGVNVGCRIYRISTRLTEFGGTVAVGDDTSTTSKRTGETKDEPASAVRDFTREELNREITIPAQIRAVLQEYKDAVYRDLYPDREPDYDYIPKTLIFAQSEHHAKKIVEIAREVFGKQDDPHFVQQITYSCEKPDQLISSFRNDRDFRIAVTVTLVATGTDIRPLEVVMFMRDIESEALYIQMKGRGTRVLTDDALRAVTPNAKGKDLFFLVDCVGVTEHEKKTKAPSDGNPTVKFYQPSLENLLEQLSHGYVPDDYIELLASYLARVNIKAQKKYPKKARKITELLGIDLGKFALGLFDVLKAGKLPPFSNSSEPNEARRKLVAPLIGNVKARDLILEVQAGYYLEDRTVTDEVTESGFTVEEAASSTQAFEKYVLDHRDDIEALRIIYNSEKAPITREMLSDLTEKIKETIKSFSVPRLWSSYQVLNQKAVDPLDQPKEREAVTNLIQLVRYAYKKIPYLQSMYNTAAQKFELWCGQKQRELKPEQKEVLRQVAEYVAANGSYTFQDLMKIDQAGAARLSVSCGSWQAANELIVDMSGFIINERKAA